LAAVVTGALAGTVEACAQAMVLGDEGRAALTTADALDRELLRRRQDLIRLDFGAAATPSRDIANEILLCVREAGEPLDAPARRPLPAGEAQPLMTPVATAAAPPTTTGTGAGAAGGSPERRALLELLAPEDRDRLLAAGEQVTFKFGDSIVREGDEADALFVILEGRARAVK